MGTPNGVSGTELASRKKLLLRANVAFLDKTDDPDRATSLLDAIVIYALNSELVKRNDKPLLDYDWSIPGYVRPDIADPFLWRKLLEQNDFAKFRMLRVIRDIGWPDGRVYTLVLSRHLSIQGWALLIWSTDRVELYASSSAELIDKFFVGVYQQEFIRRVLGGVWAALAKSVETKLAKAMQDQAEAGMFEALRRVLD